MHSSIVEKLLRLLTIISEARQPLTFSDVVKKSGLNKSTTHRLLALCNDEQLVRFDSHRKVYLLGPRVFDLVRNADKGHDIQAIALDEMIALSEMFDANVVLGVPSGLEVLCLRVLEPAQTMGDIQRPGMREAIHCSASGKALLAFLPNKLIASKLGGYEFTRYTDRTIADLEAFKAELENVREHGYGKNDREGYDHFLGISAPIFNYVGEPVAALSISSVYPRHSMETLIEWSEDLKSSAFRVSELIGGIMPDLSDLKAS